MKAGVPLNKLDCFRGLLEENSLRLPTSSHISEMIPIIHRDEEIKIHEELNCKNISIVFDGTTHVCEAMVIVVRFVDKTWNIQQ